MWGGAGLFAAAFAVLLLPGCVWAQTESNLTGSSLARPGKFCQGDIVGCPGAYALGFGYLVSACCFMLSLCLSRNALAEEQWLDGNGSQRKVRLLKVIKTAALFLVPKVIVTGASLAHAVADEFSSVFWYVLAGFLIVAATLALACSLIFLGPQITTENGRHLVALLTASLHTALSASLLLFVVLAAKYPSQRELCVLHGCVDLAQLFALQLFVLRIGADSDTPTGIGDPYHWNVVGAGWLLLDSGNHIYVTLYGMWAWVDVVDGTPLPAYTMGIVVWCLRQLFFGIVAFKSLMGNDELKGHYKRAIPAILGIACATMVTVTLAHPHVRSSLPGGYFPVCIFFMFLPHCWVSPIQFVYALVACFICWFDLASPGYLVAHIWLGAAVAASDYYSRRGSLNVLVRATSRNDLDDATRYRAALLPVSIHQLFVLAAVSSKGINAVLGISLFLVEVFYCAAVGWYILAARHTDTGELVIPNSYRSITCSNWLCLWMTFVTTAIGMLSMSTSLSALGMYTAIATLAIGGLLFAVVFPIARTAASASLSNGILVLVLTGLPAVYFVLDAGSDRSALTALYIRQGSGYVVLMACIFIVQVLVCLWYSVFKLKADWRNETEQSWVPESIVPLTACRFLRADDCGAMDPKLMVWSFVLLHSLLTLISIIGALDTLGIVPSNGNYCVGVAHPDALAADTFRCASPTDMATLDVSFWFPITAMFLLLVGEAVNKTHGDPDSVWPDSCTAKVAENSLQLLLTGQALYSMLRLRTQSDPLYVLFIALNLVWIFLLMLSRQYREGYGATTGADRPTTWDWGVMYMLEAWDVINSIIVAVAIARDTENDWPTWIADTYVVFAVLTLFLFEATYPFWTSLKRIAAFSCFNDLVTDGPMIYLMARYGLYEQSTVTAIAAFVNGCIIAFGVVIWPLKYYITVVLKVSAPAEGTPPHHP